MIRINSNDSTVISNGQDQVPQGAPAKKQCYLLSQPMQDTTNFSGKEQPPKKDNTFAWIIGTVAAIAAVVIAVKSHKKVDTKTVEKAVEETKPKATTSPSGGSRTYAPKTEPYVETDAITASKIIKKRQHTEELENLENFVKETRTGNINSREAGEAHKTRQKELNETFSQTNIDTAAANRVHNIYDNLGKSPSKVKEHHYWEYTKTEPIKTPTPETNKT